MLNKLFSLFSRKSKKTAPIAVSSTFDLQPTYEIDEKELTIRRLLKEATQLKKDKDYDAACEKLKEAYTAADDTLLVKQYLRLPMYLQLAGRNDEAWAELNRINITYFDVFSQAEIANQMRIFLEKEKKFRRALDFAVWSLCQSIERDIYNVRQCEKDTNDYAKINKEYGFDDNNDGPTYGETKVGTPITDGAYKWFSDRIANSSSVEGVVAAIQKLMKKLKHEDATLDLANDLSTYLKSTTQFDLRKVQKIIALHT